MLEQLKFPSEIAKEIAENEKKKRKFRKLTQKQLSQYSGVSLPSLKRFEQTGEISLISLLKIASGRPYVKERRNYSFSDICGLLVGNCRMYGNGGTGI